MGDIPADIDVTVGPTVGHFDFYFVYSFLLGLHVGGRERGFVTCVFLRSTSVHFCLSIASGLMVIYTTYHMGSVVASMRCQVYFRGWRAYGVFYSYVLE